MYSKYQLYQCFYLPFIVVASLHFAGTPQTVAAQEAQYDVAKTSEAAASQVTQNNNEKKPYDVIKENKWTLAVVGTFLGVVGLWWVISKNAKRDGNQGREVRIEGDTSLIGDYVFICDKDGKSKAYALSINLAWDEFCRKYNEGKKLNIKLELTGKEEERAQKIIENLNEKSKKRIQETASEGDEWYIVKAGEAPEVIREYNQEVRTRFNNDKALLLNESEFKNLIKAAIAAVKIEVRFDPPFDEKTLTINGKKVKAFGCTEDNQDPAKNIRQIAFKNENEFIIEIATKNKDFTFCLMKGYKKKLQEGIDIIRDKSKHESFSGIKELTVPEVEACFESNYEDIFKGATIKGGKMDGIPLSVYQKIAFSMNREGASGKSVAVVMTRESASFGKKEKRHYEFGEEFHALFIPKGQEGEAKGSAIIIEVSGDKLMTEVE